VFNAKWQEWMEEISWTHSKFCVLIPVISENAFGTFARKDSTRVALNVFAVKEPYDYVGICSTETEVSEAVSDDGETNRIVKIERVKDFKDWNGRVTKGNAMLNTWFLNPRVLFNPVSNMIRPPKRGYVVSLDTDGELVYSFIPGSNAEYSHLPFQAEEVTTEVINLGVLSIKEKGQEGETTEGYFSQENVTDPSFISSSQSSSSSSSSLSSTSVLTGELQVFTSQMPEGQEGGEYESSTTAEDTPMPE